MTIEKSKTLPERMDDVVKEMKKVLLKVPSLLGKDNRRSHVDKSVDNLVAGNVDMTGFSPYSVHAPRRTVDKVKVRYGSKEPFIRLSEAPEKLESDARFELHSMEELVERGRSVHGDLMSELIDNAIKRKECATYRYLHTKGLSVAMNRATKEVQVFDKSGLDWVGTTWLLELLTEFDAIYSAQSPYV